MRKQFSSLIWDNTLMEPGAALTPVCAFITVKLLDFYLLNALDPKDSVKN